MLHVFETCHSKLWVLSGVVLRSGIYVKVGVGALHVGIEKMKQKPTKMLCIV